jgi:hypothetical protein
VRARNGIDGVVVVAVWEDLELAENVVHPRTAQEPHVSGLSSGA